MFILLSGAFFSSVVSGVTGFAGGLLLLSIITVVYGAQLAIPLHALLQVVSNFSRVVIFYPFIDWKTVAFYLIGLIPGVYLGTKIYVALPKDFFQMGIGIFVLLTLLVKVKEGRKFHNRLYYGVGVMGIFSGFLGVLVGAIGPTLTVMLRSLKLTKEHFIATKAACQLNLQVLKVVAFSKLLNFSYRDFAQELVFMAMALFLGTLVAKKILTKVPVEFFNKGVTVILIILALTMIFQSVASILPTFPF